MGRNNYGVEVLEGDGSGRDVLRGAGEDGKRGAGLVVNFLPEEYEACGKGVEELTFLEEGVGGLELCVSSYLTSFFF